jgi:transposase InsO family protein
MRGEGIGARRIQTELRLFGHTEFALATIHKVLTAARVKPLVRRKPTHAPQRYSRPIPGDRVQMDTMKVAPGVYQYTAIDDCSRFRVLGVHRRRDARNTLQFLERVTEEMPFPIQRVQTDRGTEFFAESVQRRLMASSIKFRPIPPRSPHLNGKVERSQLTDLMEFWSRHSPKEEAIQERIEEWQFVYNYRRSHGALGGKTPAERIAEIGDRVPLSEIVVANYDESKERIRHSDWKKDQAMAALHGSRVR